MAEEWTISEDRPGYRVKTIQHGNATVMIYRPILTEAEAAKAQTKVKADMEAALRQYYGRLDRMAAS